MPLNHSSKFAELTDEQFLVIGKIVIEFSNMEHLLGVLSSRLLLIPDFLGRSYIDKINASALQEVIINALEIHQFRFNSSIISTDQIREIKSLIQRITQIRSIRNTFAHYCWTRVTDEEIFGSKLSGNIPKEASPNKDTKLITNQDLIDTYKQAYSIVEELKRIIDIFPELDEEKQVFNLINSKATK